MTNYYHLTNDAITISVKKSKKHTKKELIKFNLFCEINACLVGTYTLYDYSMEKNKYCEERFINSIKIPAFTRKKLYLYNVDDFLITFVKYDENEILKQHRTISPETDYEYFREWYATGLIDIEYFAVNKSIDFKTVFLKHLNGTSRKDVVNAIKKTADIYISLYDSDGMEIFFNNKEIYDDVLEIVKKHCIESQVKWP